MQVAVSQTNAYRSSNADKRIEMDGWPVDFVYPGVGLELRGEDEKEGRGTRVTKHQIERNE